jgi:hypothetical protein
MPEIVRIVLVDHFQKWNEVHTGFDCTSSYFRGQIEARATPHAERAPATKRRRVLKSFDEVSGTSRHFPLDHDIQTCGGLFGYPSCPTKLDRSEQTIVLLICF